jgi:hypothetical protein
MGPDDADDTYEPRGDVSDVRHPSSTSRDTSNVGCAGQALSRAIAMDPSHDAKYWMGLLSRVRVGYILGGRDKTRQDKATRQSGSGAYVRCQVNGGCLDGILT